MKPKAPTADLRAAVRAYLLARTVAEVTRERVNAVYRDILTETPIMADHDKHCDGLPIMGPEKLYLASDDEAVKRCWAEADRRLRQKGIKPADMEPEYCPALVAESTQRQAEALIVEAGAAMLGEGKGFHGRLLCAGLEKYEQFVDLCCKLVVNEPGFRNPLTDQLVA